MHDTYLSIYLMYMKINHLILWQCKWFDCGMDYISMNWNVLILILKYMYISFHFDRLEVFPIYLVLQIFSGIYAPVSKKIYYTSCMRGKKRTNQKPKYKIQVSPYWHVKVDNTLAHCQDELSLFLIHG